MQAPRQIEIWFFIGALLLVYGVLITAAGLFHFVHPPVRHVALEDLHADVWWGALLIALGAFYTRRFWPWRRS
ncbi:MAG TPA: hypothetical protein VML00_08540 [Bacteroidota bacterium]|nr:hypothetical protein [Bacteroidota bacterium]